MNYIYSLSAEQLAEKSGIEVKVTESDIDLYYHMALSMYREIENNNSKARKTVMILPVGPVFQYRKFITLLSYRPLSLENLHIFFMDEYLEPGTDKPISADSPLSFRGFVERELLGPLSGKYSFSAEQVYFPDPSSPSEYDSKIAELGGVDICHAGVGIVGHLAFNEPVSSGESSPTEFSRLPTRIVKLTRETITINSNTALRGAYEEIPERAVTVGMSSILGARRLELYMNRYWQAAVLRKTLMLEPTSEFPATLVKSHPNISITVTPEVAAVPDLALK